METAQPSNPTVAEMHMLRMDLRGPFQVQQVHHGKVVGTFAAHHVKLSNLADNIGILEWADDTAVGDAFSGFFQIDPSTLSIAHGYLSVLVDDHQSFVKVTQA